MTRAYGVGESGRWILGTVAALWIASGCGVEKQLVRNEARNGFDNAASVAAHAQAKCGTAGDADCTEIAAKLGQLCAALDELDKAADGKGFDCSQWKVRP